jgi:hypothetical protein
MLKALQMLGLLAVALGVGMIYTPAGVIVAGLGLFAAGELLSDTFRIGKGE